MTLAPLPRPCGSCPYRRDVPSGIWDASEYAKLPLYDVETASQPLSVFACHQSSGHLCSGWVGCHDMEESLGLKIAAATGHLSIEEFEATLAYVSPVPLFASGREAAEHGMRDYEEPGERANRVRAKMAKKIQDAL